MADNSRAIYDVKICSDCSEKLDPDGICWCYLRARSVSLESDKFNNQWDETAKTTYPVTG